MYHCAEASVFGAARRPWEKKDIAVALTGTIGREHYPLRTRWQRLCHEISAAVGEPVLCHPRPPHLATDLESANRHVALYAEILGRAKLVLVATALALTLLLSAVRRSKTCSQDECPAERNCAESSTAGGISHNSTVTVEGTASGGIVTFTLPDGLVRWSPRPPTVC